MIASHKAQTTVARTRETCSRLLGWMERGNVLPAERRESLRRDVEELLLRLDHCSEVFDAAPAIGLVGAPLQTQFELIGGLLGRRGRTLVADFAEGGDQIKVASGILPTAPDDDASAVVRVAASVQSPRGYPVRAALLGEQDLIKILAWLFDAHAPRSAAGPVAADRIARAFELAAGGMLANAVPGMSARDVVDLREYLARRCGRSERLASLDGAGYWRRLAQMAPYLGATERRRLVSLLWAEDEAIGELHVRLSGALATLGQASEVFLQLHSLTTSNPETGWLEPHGQSVLAASTIDALAADVPVEQMVAVALGSGLELRAPRPALAALLREVTLPIASATLAPLQNAELLVFPGPRAVACDALATTRPGTLTSWRGYALPVLFAAAKASYLVDRAVERNEMTSLVVNLGDDRTETGNDAHSGLVSDWVEAAQGAEPHTRQRRHCGLIVVSMDRREPGTANASSDSEAVLDDLLGADGGWRREWTPGARFASYYVCRAAADEGDDGRRRNRMPRISAAPSLVGALPSALAPPPASGAHAALARATAGPLWQNDGAILDALQAAATPRAKLAQIDMRVASLRREMRSRLLRHHLSSEPHSLGEWRAQMGNVAASRLMRAAEQGRLGRLVAALSPSARELEPVVEAVDKGYASVPAEGGLARLATRGLEQDFDRSVDYAAAIVAHWNLGLGSIGRSPRLARGFDLPIAVLRHVVDEIAVGAVRVGLSRHLAEVIVRSQAVTQDPPARAQRIASYAAHVIGGYVETLAAHDAAAAQTSGAAGAGPLAVRWCRAFSALVDANIAAAPSAAVSPDRDRELGDIIAQLASSSFEVDP